MYAYYLAKTKKVYGTNDAATKALLYAAYMKALQPQDKPGTYDGASLLPDGSVVVIVRVNGAKKPGEPYTGLILTHKS